MLPLHHTLCCLDLRCAVQVAAHTSEACTALFSAVLDAVPVKAPPPKYHHTETYTDEVTGVLKVCS